MEDLLEKLKRIQSEKAQSMYFRCYALYLTYIEQDYGAAMQMIDKAIQEFPIDKKYSLSIKFDVARFFRDIDGMNKIINELEADGVKNNTIVICRSKLLAAQGKNKEAVNYFNKHIMFFTDQSKEAFCKSLLMK